LRPFQIRIFVKWQHIWTFYLNLSTSSVCETLSVVNVHMYVLAWYLYSTQRIYLFLVSYPDWYFLHKSNKKSSFSFSVLDCGQIPTVNYIKIRHISDVTPQSRTEKEKLDFMFDLWNYSFYKVSSISSWGMNGSPNIMISHFPMSLSLFL
jgi:hypothetical protein